MGAKVGNKNASIYTDELAIEICDLVANGMNIKKALQCKDEFPDFSTWCRWKRDNQFVCNLYVNSIQDKADGVDNQIDETIDELKNGDIDASTANVIIQTYKWKAAKYYPKMFGEKLDVTSKDKEIKSNPKINLIIDSKEYNLKEE